MDKELVGHIQMCVRMKLRKDEKEFRSKKDNKVHERILRGYAALAILRQMKKDE